MLNLLLSLRLLCVLFKLLRAWAVLIAVTVLLGEVGVFADWGQWESAGDVHCYLVSLLTKLVYNRLQCIYVLLRLFWAEKSCVILV